jgi:hypothetical protein
MSKKQTILVIKNNQPRAIELPPVPSKEATTEEIMGLTLIPGENNVTQVAWDHAKKNPGIKIWLACEYLESLGAGEAKSLGEGLDSLTAGEAKAKIANCGEVKILQDWKEKTTKKALEKLITTRITALVAAAGNEE